MDIISYNIGATANSRIESFIENPDSTSGVLTVPKVISAGETITIPAGRVAVLPNVQVDGTLNISGEVFIPSGATTADLDNRIALKADTTYVNTQLSNKANTADLKEIGVGQTWQDVTASRSFGVTYTNTTGKPICVVVTAGTITAPAYITVAVDGIGVTHGGMISSSATIFTNVSFIVPKGSTYRVSISAGSVSLNLWTELR